MRGGADMNIKLTIPERLKDLRTECGLTLEQLFEATGISRAALGKYEADDFMRRTISRTSARSASRRWQSSMGYPPIT